MYNWYLDKPDSESVVAFQERVGLLMVETLFSGEDKLNEAGPVVSGVTVKRWVE